MDPEVIQQLQNSLSDFVTILGRQNDAMDNLVKSLTNASQELNNNIKTGQSETAAEKQASEAARDAAKAYKEAAEYEKTRAQAVNQATDLAVGGLKNFTTALLDSEKGLHKFGNSLTSFGEAALALTAGLNPLVVGIGLGVLAFTKMQAAALKVDDNLIEFRDKMAEAGGVMPMTSEEIGKLASAAGYSGDAIKKLQEATVKYTPSMMGLGGSVGEAKTKWLQLVDVGDDTYQRYRRMGYSQEDILDNLGKFTEFQQLSGQSLVNSTKDMAKLKKASMEYSDNLVLFQTLSQKKTDQLQDATKDVEMQLQEQIMKAAENERIKKLQQRIANDPRDAAAKKELADIQEDQKARDTLAQQAGASGLGTETVKMLEDTLRLKGGYSSFSKGIANLGIDDELRRYRESKKTKEDAARLIDAVQKAQGSKLEKFGNSLIYSNEQNARSSLAAQGLSEESINNIVKFGTNYFDRFIGAQKTMADAGKKGADKVQDTAATVETLERKAQRGWQNLLNSMDLLRGGFLGFALALSLSVGGGAVVGGLMGKFGIGMPKFGNAAKMASGAGAAANELGTLSNVAGSSGGAATGGFLIGLVEGFTAAGAASATIVVGGGALGLAIAAMVAGLGTGLAAAIYIIGRSLPSLAENLKPFEKLNGKNLEQVGNGMAGLGVGFSALGGGKIVNVFGDLFKLGNSKDPLTGVLTQLTVLQKYPIDKNIVANNSEAIATFFMNTSKLQSTYNAGSLTSLFGKLASMFTGGPIKQFEDFAKKDFGPNMTINTDAFHKYAESLNIISTQPASNPPSGGGGGGGNPPPSGGGFMGAIRSGVNAVAGLLGGGGTSPAAQGAPDLGQRSSAEVTGRPDEAMISAQGKSVKVAKAAAARFQATLDFMTKHGYKIRSLGGYNDRDVVGRPGTKSAHSRGWAIDVNPDANPLQEGGGPVKTDMSPEIIAFAKSQGLGWGGSWRSRRDAMHFSAQKNEGGNLIPGKAAAGGIFTEMNSSQLPNSQKLAALNTQSILLKLAKTSSDSIKNISSAMHNDMGNDQSKVTLELYNMIDVKLNHVLTALEQNHDTHSKILKHSMG